MNYGRKGLPADVRQGIIEDLAVAIEYAKEGERHTLLAIAARRGVHKRTVQKIMAKEGIVGLAAYKGRLRRLEQA